MQQNQEAPRVGEQAGLLWTWWQGDPLPTLSPLLDFAVKEAQDKELLASLMNISPTEIIELLQEGHRPYLARLGSVPVAYGWSASGRATFGGGRIIFQVPAGNHYLYNFVTLPAWRGLGIYPRLLQAILRHESSLNKRYWINHQSSNTASEKGISKAGFRLASKVYFLDTGKLCLIAGSDESERAEVGAALLGLELLQE
jgi:hypothetical protein